MPAAIDWSEIHLVVFDMDGTLYDQRRLRLRMLAALIGASLRSGSIDVPLTLREFRRSREALAIAPDLDFLVAQYAIPAARRGCGAEAVRSLVVEWMEERPLRHLASCRRPGIDRLFGSLREMGKRIGILSDYPASAKLDALGLSADFIVSSTDVDVAKPKPDPAGLQKLMRLAQVDPAHTLMIGDRIDRDGEVASRSNVLAWILTPRAEPQANCFRSFLDPVFDPLLAPPSGGYTRSP